MAGLKYISWADNTGYAVAAKSYLRVLQQAGVTLSWVPMLPGPQGYEARESVPGELGQLANRPIDYDTVLIHTVPEYFPEWIERERPGGRRILGYTVWELDDLPGHWPAILNRLDGVIVPCSFNVEVFRRSTWCRTCPSSSKARPPPTPTGPPCGGGSASIASPPILLSSTASASGPIARRPISRSRRTGPPSLPTSPCSW